MSLNGPTRPLLLGAILLALIFGFALGALLGPGGSVEAGSEASAPLGAEVVTSSPARDRASAAPMKLGAAGAARSEAVVEAAAAAGVSAKRLRAAKSALALQEVAAAPVGSGVIRIEVRTADGTPLAGVELVGGHSNRIYYSTRDSSRVGAAAPEPTSLDEAIKAAAERWAEGRAGRLRAITDADGRATIEGLTEGAYSFSAYLQDWIISASNSTARTGDMMHFQAKPVHQLELDVRLPDGTQPTSAVVELRTGSWNPERIGWSPDSPVLRFGTGAFDMVVYDTPLDLFDPNNSLPSLHSSDELKLDMSTPPTETVRVELHARVGLRGHVVHTWPTESVNDNVAIVRVDDPSAFDPLKPSGSMRTTYTVGGDFLFIDLEPGTYAVGLVPERYPGMQRFIDHRMVELREGIAELTFEVGAPDLASSIVVECLTADGRPAEDLRFHCAVQSSRYTSNPEVKGTRGPDGRYWFNTASLSDFDFDAWPKGASLKLSAKSDAHGMQMIELESGRHEYSLQFTPTGSLTVRIAGYEGRSAALEYLIEVLAPDAEGSNPTPVARSQSVSYAGSDPAISATGEVVFDTIPVGRWRVNLMTGKQRFSREVIAHQDVQVSVGGATCELSIAEVHELAVFAPNLEPGDRISLMKVDKAGHSYTSAGWEPLDEQRRVVFSGLMPGDYRLQGQGLGDGLDIQVPCPEVVFDPVLPNALMVTISNEQGQLYQAGLRSGDLITSINGRRLEEAGAMGALQQSGAPRALDLTVERGDETMSFSLGPFAENQQTAASLGGTFVPTRK